MIRILTNIVELCGLSRVCCHRRHREVSAGKVKVQRGVKVGFVNRTEVAGAHPEVLAEE